MNEKDWIDKLYNSYFQEEEIPFDENHWKQFEADYLGSKKSKPVAWIAASALLVAAAGTAIWLTASVDETAPIAQTENTIPVAGKTLDNESVGTASFTEAQRQLQEQNASSTESTASETSDETISVNTESASPNSVAADGSNSSALSVREASPSGGTPEGDQAEKIAAPSAGYLASVNTAESSQTTAAESSAQAVQPEMEPETNATVLSSADLSPIQRRNAGSFEVNWSNEMSEESAAPAVAPSVAPEPRYARNMDWFAEYYLGGGMLHQSQISGSGIHHQAISDFQMQEAYTFNSGIRVGTKVKDFVFMAGLGYQYENQKFSWNYLYDETRTEQYITTTTETEVIVNDALPTVFLGGQNGSQFRPVPRPNDTLVTTVSDTQNVEITESYQKALTSQLQTHYLEIPVLVGYELEKGDFGFQALGGVVPRILTGSSGASYTAEGITFPMDLNEDILNPVALDYNVQLRMMYRVFPQWKVFAGARYRGNLTSAYKNTSPIIYKHAGLGLTCGIRLDF